MSNLWENVSTPVGTPLNGKLWIYLSGWTADVWNFLSRNVTSDIYSFLGGRDLTNIVLYRIDAIYHFSSVSPGGFYIDDLSLTEGEIPTPWFTVEWIPTSPPPLIPSVTPRQTEPVLVSVNVTETGSHIDYFRLSYRADGGDWWETTMTYNASSGLWVKQIPGQGGNTTVEFFVTAVYDSSEMTSSMYTFEVEALLAGDLNGDGKVDLLDIFMAILNYGKES